MFVKLVLVTAHEDDAGPQLLLQEGLEELEHHVEDVGLVHDV